MGDAFLIAGRSGKWLFFSSQANAARKLSSSEGSLYAPGSRQPARLTMEVKKGQDSDLGRTSTGLPPRLFHPLPAWSCRHPQLCPTSSPLKLLHPSLTPHQIPLGSPPMPSQLCSTCDSNCLHMSDHTQTLSRFPPLHTRPGRVSMPSALHAGPTPFFSSASLS